MSDNDTLAALQKSAEWLGRLSQLENIVHLLAHCPPPIKTGYWEQSECALCDHSADADSPLDWHNESCPWRLARELAQNTE